MDAVLNDINEINEEEEEGKDGGLDCCCEMKFGYSVRGLARTNHSRFLDPRY